MFTGLIQKTGKIVSRKTSGGDGKLVIGVCGEAFEDLENGESISVNGTCLTLEKADGANMTFHVLKETFDKTCLGSLPVGSKVNLERALAFGSRMGGHIVTGHVDGTGKVVSIGREGADMVLSVSVPEGTEKYFVPKGSIALDGTSLTIAKISGSIVSVCIIPTTWRETSLSERKVGDVVNVESDIIGKFVAKQLEAFLSPDKVKNLSGESVTMEKLFSAGFGE